DSLVSMGGYNTLIEALRSGTPTVCVPRVSPRTEQLLRAQAFARLGLLRLLPPERLEPGNPRQEIAPALGTPRAGLKKRARAALALAGAILPGCEWIELARTRGAEGAAAAVPGAA